MTGQIDLSKLPMVIPYGLLYCTSAQKHNLSEFTQKPKCTTHLVSLLRDLNVLLTSVDICNVSYILTWLFASLQTHTIKTRLSLSSAFFPFTIPLLEKMNVSFFPMAVMDFFYASLRKIKAERETSTQQVPFCPLAQFRSLCVLCSSVEQFPM